MVIGWRFPRGKPREAKELDLSNALVTWLTETVSEKNTGSRKDVNA